MIALLFAINLPLIQRTLKNTNFFERLLSRPAAETDIAAGKSQKSDDEQQPVENNKIIEAAPYRSDPIVPVQSEPEKNIPASESSGQKNEVQKEEQKTQEPVPPAPPPVAKRDRIIYFVKVDGTGLVFTSPVKRSLAVSDSPLLDALNELLQGPSRAERQQGLTSLLPEGSRILSARVQSGTAFVNFNENFMFNGFGAEGYIAQLRQIVWTATEFPNVSDVQILIEGQRVEYLGESIRIGRPISRDSL
ncbi:hypothetical protein AGMMS50212_13760 [Spirochaetia bacterium]|nr:hypothetical protein AGMMS50212_13760 [Spirochaetia bacterium]